MQNDIYYYVNYNFKLLTKKCTKTIFLKIPFIIFKFNTHILYFTVAITIVRYYLLTLL